MCFISFLKVFVILSHDVLHDVFLNAISIEIFFFISGKLWVFILKDFFPSLGLARYDTSLVLFFCRAYLRDYLILFKVTTFETRGLGGCVLVENIGSVNLWDNEATSTIYLENLSLDHVEVSFVIREEILNNKHISNTKPNIAQFDIWIC